MWIEPHLNINKQKAVEKTQTNTHTQIPKKQTKKPRQQTFSGWCTQVLLCPNCHLHPVSTAGSVNSESSLMGVPEKVRQVKHPKPLGKILFSEPVRKNNPSNHEQNPLSDLMLGVKTANNIYWHQTPSWAPPLPPGPYWNKEEKTQAKIPQTKPLERQIFPQFRLLRIQGEFRSRSVRVGTAIRAAS